MGRFQKTISVVNSILAAALVAVQVGGCAQATSKGPLSPKYVSSGPVDFIQLLKAKPDFRPPPGRFGETPQPFVDSVQVLVAPGDGIFVDLSVSKGNREAITFSKYTFYNQHTNQEDAVVVASDDLGPFQPDQHPKIGVGYSLRVPDQPDVYQSRVYLGGEIVASALFDVRIPNPVDYIGVSRVIPGVPPDFGAGTPRNPYPDAIQGVFSPGDKVYLGLIINKEIKDPVTFSGYSVYSRRTGRETVLEATGEIGPFQPGQMPLIAFHNPWPVPEQPDVYEIRIYVDDKVVASALFEVR